MDEKLTVMARLVVTGWSTLLAILAGWRLSIGTSSWRRVSRRCLLLLLCLLLVSLLLAIACLLGLVARLLLTISCWLGVATLVVTSRLAVSIVTEAKARHSIKTKKRQRNNEEKQIFFPGLNTFEVQWEPPADHIQDKQTEQYTLAENYTTGKQLEQQQLEYCHNHWRHNPGLTVSSYEW